MLAKASAGIGAARVSGPSTMLKSLSNLAWLRASAPRQP